MNDHHLEPYQPSALRPFHKSLIEDLFEHLTAVKQADLSLYAATLVVLPTRRAVKDLKFALSHRATKATILPKIIAISDLPTFVLGTQKPCVSDIKRLALAYQMLQDLDSDYGLAPSFQTAKDILKLVDDVMIHDVNLDDLDDLVPETYAEHWQSTSSFLKAFVTKWQLMLSEMNLLEVSQRDKQDYERICRLWEAYPPQHPVMIAGLDGFIPYLRTLIDVTQSLPNGQVFWTGVIPFDDSSHNTGAVKTHPNYLSAQQMQAISHQTNFVDQRSQMLGHMFSDQPFDDRDLSQCSLSGIALHQAKTQADEAEMVALITRHALNDPHKTIAIVTPDPELSNGIQKELALWGIQVDAAAGQSAFDQPEAKFISRMLDCEPLMPNPLMAFTLLKDKLTTLPEAQKILALEPIWRGGRSVQADDAQGLNLQSASELWSKQVDPLLLRKREPDSCCRQLTTALEEVCQTLSVPVAESMVFTRLKAKLSELSEVIKSLPYGEFASAVRLFLQDDIEREAVNHPQVRLMSPIQSAFSQFDQTILCGLNEGVWPAITAENPWLNLDMQMKLGMPDRQVLLGRGAWLLAQNMRAKSVVMTYSQRREGTPIAPSRWVLRLRALGRALERAPDAKEKPQTLSLDPSYEKILQIRRLPSSRIYSQGPSPTPDVASRPARFSVTDIENLIKDPYQIYAKTVLNLYPLHDLSATQTQSEFGTFVHGCLEYVVKANATFSEAMASALSALKAGRSVYGIGPVDRATQIMWQQMISRFEPWIDAYLIQQKSYAEPLYVEHAMAVSQVLMPSHDISKPIEIIGKADRIDRLQDGTYEIIDYKTGYTPSKKDVMTGVSPQLPLLAKLFEEQNPGARVSKLTYVSLGTQTISRFDTHPLVAETWSEVLDMLTRYSHPQTPYDIDVKASLTDPYNAYAHLERTREWIEERLTSSRMSADKPSEALNKEAS